MFIARTTTTTQPHNHLRSLRRLRSSLHSRESLSLSPNFCCAQIHFHRIITILMVASWRRILHKQFYERERASYGSSKWQRTTQSTNFPFRYIWRAKANYIKSNSLISVIHWKIIFVDIPLPLLRSSARFVRSQTRMRFVEFWLFELLTSGLSHVTRASLEMGKSIWKYSFCIQKWFQLMRKWLLILALTLTDWSVCRSISFEMHG